VDDAQDDREMYALFLSSVGGCEVTQAASGTEALGVLERETPDVVILDVVLPGLDGTEVCRRVRHSPATDRTAVVALTGLPLHSDGVGRMISAGPDALLIKPCAPDLLLAEIRRLLRHSRTLRQRGVTERERATDLRVRSNQLQERVRETHRVAHERLRHAEHLTLSQRVIANYVELPGLSLTPRQAMRMWGFDEPTCLRILDTLTSDGFLIRTEDGQYRRRNH
jgi:DNA-binding response OmpR family regulator